VAWFALVVGTALAVLNHGMGVFAIAEGDTEQLMFALFALLNVYAMAVLLGPYQQGETWAWLVAWVEVAAFAVVLPLAGDGMGIDYLVVAILAAVAQATTYPLFTGRGADR
jgi:hypothetical protein